MAKKLLEIKNLSARVADREILHEINLTIHEGEVHVLMGPNGSGKSTLANVMMNNPAYTVTAGDILLEGESILSLSTDKRARKGLFMSFQSPYSVEGITVENFIRTARNTHEGKNVGILKFRKALEEKMALLSMNPSYAERYLNVGFSGGEKKKNEILQMLMLDPKLAILDETDSGLDVDATRIVSAGIEAFLGEGKQKAALIITHHRELIRSVTPDVVHVIVDGRLVMEGGADLVGEIEEKGFNWIREGLKNGD